MHLDLELTRELQTVDREIARLSAEVAYLPRHIKEIESKLAGAQARLDADRKALVENQKERKKLEGGIGVVEVKISKYKDQMLDVKTNDQYKAFQHEIGFAEVEIRKIEDKILELMVQAEEVDARVKKTEKQLAAERVEVEKEKAEATARTRSDEASLAELRARREQLRSQVTPAILRTYDSLQKTRKGIAVAEIRDGACTECNVRLRPQYYQEVKVGDGVKYCESCARIMYYVTPEPPAEQAGQSASSEA